MGKSTISMAIFNSFLYVYQRVCFFPKLPWFSEGSNPQSIRECQLIQWPFQVPKLELPGAIVPTSNYTMWVWLVVFRPTPLKNMSQLGWWNSQYMDKMKNVPNHQPVWLWGYIWLYHGIAPSPYIDLIYGGHLQVRYRKWPLIPQLPCWFTQLTQTVCKWQAPFCGQG